MKKADFSNPKFCLFVAQETARLLHMEFVCKGCGQCCYEKEIIILNNELECISTSMGMTEKEFRLKYLRKVRNNWSIRRSNPCLFFDVKTRKCTIYQNRPINCRIFPFLTDWFVYDVALFLHGREPIHRNTLPKSCAANENMNDGVNNALKKILDRIGDGTLLVPPEYLE